MAVVGAHVVEHPRRLDGGQATPDQDPEQGPWVMGVVANVPDIAANHRADGSWWTWLSTGSSTVVRMAPAYASSRHCRS
ncbi:hypothetical protein [Iamia sp.]|uniref:hypothetical protein n=1 Tax=Iamia sp. TaxID=2722710 RepID=UPI002BE0726B|nr:hypothetical protein [Iamia sp.]HXH58124.1 hypothetical protein [Iamia sp.]